MKKTPPKWFVDSLKRYDPKLRVRWSLEKRKWVIECKAIQDALYKPVKFEKVGDVFVERLLPENCDKSIGYRDGYYQIVYATNLCEKLINKIAQLDMGQFKNRNEYIRKVEDATRKEEEETEKEMSNQVTAIAGEAYDTMKRRIGETSVMGGNSKVCHGDWW